MKKLLLFIAILGLGACAGVDPSPRRLSDNEISNLSKDHLCVLAPTYNDVRIDSRIAKLKLNCDPRNLYCEGKGFKKGTKSYSTCFKQANGKIAESKRMESPDYLYCSGLGFKSGTQAMATCLASWNERQLTTRMIQLQTQSNERSQTIRSMEMLSNQLNQPSQNRPISNTNCSVVNNSMHCMSW